MAQVEVDMNGVNSFKFTNAQGQVSFGRYRIESQAGGICM
jgi:catalase